MPVSPSLAVKVFAPSPVAFISAVSTPLAPLKKLLAVLVSIVPLVYLLAVVLDKEVPALKVVALDVLSVNPLASLGLVP